MDKQTIVWTLLTIPPEVFDLIQDQLSKHDLTICIRVCRAMYDRCIDLVWHTVRFSGNSESEWPLNPQRESFKATYDRARVKARESLSSNILRIRELRIASEDILDLLYFDPTTKLGPGSGGNYSDESGISSNVNNVGDGAEEGVLEDLNLEVLGIGLGSSNRHPRREQVLWSGIMEGSKESLSILQVLQLLQRSKKLRKVVFGIFQGSRIRWKDQVRILEALPPSVEELNFYASSPAPVYRDRRGRSLNPPQSELSTSVRLPVLPHLKLLIIGCFDVNTMVYKSLLQRCPSIEELHVVGQRDRSYDDSSLAELITLKGDFAPRAGWKTLGFDCILLGPLTVDAILEHCETLENFSVGENCHFPSSALQKLLSSAPRLLRLNAIPTSTPLKDLDGCKLMATDILSSDWICLELKSFNCVIGGIPRLDLYVKSNGQALMGELHNKDRYSAQDSQSIQRQVLGQLGRLTKLREITLGQDNIGQRDSQTHIPVFQSRSAMEMGKQYTCLSMKLEDGLDQLKDLKDLRRLNLGGMEVRQGRKELDWMKAQWPDLQRE